MTGRYVAFLDELNVYLGMPRLTMIVPIVPFFAPEYGYVDKINHTRGIIDSFDAIYPQLKDLDFITQAPKLDAPQKQLIWLEGGHGLGGENARYFVNVMLNKVLAETFPPDD